MIDEEVKDDIEKIRDYVDGINFLISSLYKKDVEIRIAYKESEHGNPPKLDLWRAIEHINYLKKTDTNE